MLCCDSLGEAVDRGAMYVGPKHRIDDGRIVNEIDTEYFLRSPSISRATTSLDRASLSE